MLINLSNHPSDKWGENQLLAAAVYGDIMDIPFPSVDPQADNSAVAALADEYCERIQDLSKDTTVTVHVMGEMTLTYALVRKLKTQGINCIASTTERIIERLPDGGERPVFVFSSFREYCE